MSEHYCMYKDGMCELDIDEAYQQGKADAEEEVENRYNRVLDDEKRISYEQGRADAIDEVWDTLVKYQRAIENANYPFNFIQIAFDEVRERLE